ncbi:hypothetical protein [Streptomyces sviceus]|uniref:hypothetical protein n=1 Tax=Streptomyces sviceus TaxID=285530 RepID=UPI00332CB123
MFLIVVLPVLRLLRRRLNSMAWDGVGEEQTGLDGTDLESAELAVSVSLVAGAVLERDLAPGAVPQLTAESLLVALDDQDVVGAPGCDLLGVAVWACSASAVMTWPLSSSGSSSGAKAGIAPADGGYDSDAVGLAFTAPDESGGRRDVVAEFTWGSLQRVAVP